MSCYGVNDAGMDSGPVCSFSGIVLHLAVVMHFNVAWTWLFPYFRLDGVQLLAGFGPFALRKEFAGSEQTIAD